MPTIRKTEKQKLCDSRRSRGDTRKSEQRRHQRDQKENYSPS